MKNAFSLIILFSGMISFSQELPNPTPPSPEAHAITKYGDLSINESTGKAMASVPIYTYSDGQVQVPISLNYLGNGVKVNEHNTWTGVNWTLNAGGLITRTVYHNVDEYSDRKFNEDIETLNLTDPLSDASAIEEIFDSQTKDSQPDIFNFSFAGYSGIFYLDRQNMKPILINNDSELQIKIIGSTNSTNKENLQTYKQFEIITPNGIRYFFGGEFAVEETSTERDYHNITTPRAVTSFYLTEIQHPISGSIFLEYQDVGNYTINIAHSKTINKYAPKSSLGYHSGCGVPWYTDQPLQETASSSYAASIIRSNVFGGKYLSRIFSLNNNIEVLFNSSDTIDGRKNFKNVLNSIIINSNNSLLHKVDLNYDYYYQNNIGQRFFLNKVIFDQDLDNNGIFDASNYKKYKFEYNDPITLPARFSNSQDALGYFNGKINPDGLLPEVNDLPRGFGSAFSALGGVSYATADRTRDINYKLKGTLVKMYYPTGGHTLFEYEAPPNKEITFKNEEVKVYRNNYPIGNGYSYPNDLVNSINIGGTALTPDFDDLGNPITESNGLYVSQDITIKVTVESLSQVYGHVLDKATFRIINVTNNNTLELEEDIIMPVEDAMNPENFIEYRERVHFFNKDDEYKIEVLLANNPYQGAIPMKATLQLEYNNGYKVVDGEGLRVKRVSDFTKNNASAQNIKRYYYTEIENIYKNPEDYIDVYRKPVFHEQVDLLVWESSWNSTGNPCYGDMAVSSGDYTYYNGQNLQNYNNSGSGTDEGAEQIGDFDGICSPDENDPNCYIYGRTWAQGISSARGYTYSINPVNYSENVINNYDKIVISYGGDNFENGGVEKQFIKSIGYSVMDTKYPRISTIQYSDVLRTHKGASWLNLHHGKPTKEKIFKKRGDTLYKIKENKIEYSNKIIANQEVAIGHVFGNKGSGYVYPYDNVGIGVYEILSKDTSVDFSNNIDYIDAVPVAWEGDQEPPSNPYTFKGWMIADHDMDGTSNYNDDEYLALIDSYDPSAIFDESNYRKIITTTVYKYDGDYAGQPTKVITTTSDDSRKYESVNRYLDESEVIVNSDPNLGPTDLARYVSLRTANRVNSPIQTESYVNDDGNLTLLSKNRTIYNDFQGKILPSTIKTAKGSNTLEDRVEFVDYDSSGNPTKVKKTNGSITKYTYNGLNQVVSKIENYFPPSLEFDPDNLGPSDLCQLISATYPNSQASYYYYDDVTNLLTKIFNANCQTIHYEYDEQYRLKHVKDKDGNILSKNEYNYATQN